MKKVLIIEDDPIVAHIYRTRLEKEGYSVETCADGQSGFYRIHEYHPDGVLLDLMLPKMNGVDILKKIRAQGQFGRIPIVVFTNAYVPNMIQEAFAAGASQVFNKATLTPRQILDALHLLLTRGGHPAGGSLQDNPGAISSPIGGGGFAEGGAPTTGTEKDPFGQGESSFHQQSSPPPPPPHVFDGSPPPPQSYFGPSDAATQAENAVGSQGGLDSSSSSQSSEVRADDSVFQDQLYQAFVDGQVETMSSLRRVLHELTKAQGDEARVAPLLELYRKIHAVTGSAGIAGFSTIAQMAAAVEVLLKELREKPSNLNASTLRTVAHSVDFIGELFKARDLGTGSIRETNILVVDDEILSRRAITYSLDKANLKSSSVEDPLVALDLATENVYDLIFLDVQMPGMDGFELCTKIRRIPTNKATPIIFVTSLTDFKSRAKSSLSGGTDLIAKPFMFIELTVKALNHILRNRLVQKQQAA